MMNMNINIAFEFFFTLCMYDSHEPEMMKMKLCLSYACFGLCCRVMCNMAPDMYRVHFVFCHAFYVNFFVMFCMALIIFTVCVFRSVCLIYCNIQVYFCLVLVGFCVPGLLATVVQYFDVFSHRHLYYTI